MVDVEFISEGNEAIPQSIARQKDIPFLNRLVISTGLVKTKERADAVLVIFMFLCIILTVFIAINSWRTDIAYDEAVAFLRL